ncbi:hypothetical protein CHS0354_018958 [Potamilus streckersoni]|uniref:Nicalin n=1 Tax=Potamilus streckersoni TaxID=2493646 RepID=A0AAE0T7Q4_9BIVA|nr:hypothetical protein CHS0354_018958 [Potamilus streckersoni]
MNGEQQKMKCFLLNFDGYNILFLLTGGGKFNYQGAKKWIEDNLDSTEANVLSDVAFVMCLDSLASEDSLYFHVSKPPKEDTPAATFFTHLEEVTKTFFPNVVVKMIHKKINLAEDMLAWEHERFSMKRLPAFTLSHFEAYKSLDRTSVIDTRERIDEEKLVRNVNIIAEALARQIYNLTSQGSIHLFTEALEVQKDLLSAWLDHVTSLSRAAQLLQKDSSLLVTLEETMSRYLKDVKRTYLKADKRDPEFVFYDSSIYKMNAFNVKPAVFDLFLAGAIVVYLSLVYLLVQNFHLILGLISRFVQSGTTAKMNGATKLKAN